MCVVWGTKVYRSILFVKANSMKSSVTCDEWAFRSNNFGPARWETAGIKRLRSHEVASSESVQPLGETAMWASKG